MRSATEEMSSVTERSSPHSGGKIARATLVCVDVSAACYDNGCCERGLCIVCLALHSCTWLVLADAEVAVCVASRINDRALTAVSLRKVVGTAAERGD